MDSYKTALVVGSLRKESFNRKLANALVKLAPTEFSFNELQIGNLPLYNQDDDENQADSVKRLKKEISAAQGLLFVTPEYNRSIPGVLKNALDNALTAMPGLASPPVSSALPLVPSAPHCPNSICATFSHTWTYRHSANLRPSST